MLGTYASFLLILGSSVAIGQAVFAICGRRTWSWLSPAVGLAAICAIAWGTVRLPGDGVASLAVIGVAVAIAVGYLRGRLDDLPRALRAAIPLGLAALAAASLPFLVEGRFGILGTGLDPDMSQHLLAADRLASGESGRLAELGYPLGPHSLVVAISKLGPSTVHAFDGLALAVAVSACLASLALLWRLDAPRRIVGALLVGLPYLFASYLIQGAFKETMEALFVLAFAIGLHQLAEGSLFPASSPARLRAVPLAVLAIGAVYCYSFPGLLWLAGAAGLWAVIELALVARARSPGQAETVARRAAPIAGVALLVLAIAAAPEVGRMIDFGRFETFNPAGAGLGNLFNPISPLESLGIWPSGDFRLDPGDGAVPAAGFYLGELLGFAALAYGLAWWLRRGERAVPAALAAAAALYAYAHFSGTPYQAAKATVIAAPLVMLIAVRALASGEPIPGLGGLQGALARRVDGPLGLLARHERPLRIALGVAFATAAAGSSLLALANGPVGPGSYSPELTGLRPLLGARSTLVLAPSSLLEDEHGRDYLVWELRGGRVCVAAATAPSATPPPPGVSWVITQAASGPPPFADLRLVRHAGPYTLWERRPAPIGPGTCPLIAVGERANPAS